ncbi:tetratricopeptide repeat protein [Krasilnikovia sp. MM14-A1004]|uniref:tetratricopeptide repeat protein n=1 Tax=Krasilnikovia sp. MM14-A1004 TaxID=3373541 RepID=UPI00399D5333
MKTVKELWDLLDEAHNMPFGAAQIALFEQVVPHADASGDRGLAFAARLKATQAYVYGGEPAKSFVTFSWCLSDYDRDPQPYHKKYQHTLLWYFKDMVVALTRFPEIPLSRTYAVLDDMERRYRERGASLQAVHKHRYLVATHVGDESAADQWYERWGTTPRDKLSDCAGCDPTDQVRYLSGRGRHEDAVALAESVLAGELDCSEQPQKILTALLPSYVATGRLETAAEAHRRAYRLMRSNLADLGQIGDHIFLCARSGNEHRGLEILQRHIDWLDRAPSPAEGMRFAAAGALLLRRLGALGHGDAAVRRQAHGELPAARLAEVLARHATEVAAKLDARNGTTAQSTRIAAVLGAEPFAEPFPLSPLARRRPATGTPQAPESGVAQPVLPADSPVPAIPAAAGPDELLDAAEALQRQERDTALADLMTEYDRRFGAADPGALARARRLMLAATERRAPEDVAGALAAVTEAERLFQQAGARGRAATAAGVAGVLRVFAGEVAAGLALIGADIAFQDDEGDLRERAAALARLATAQAAAGDGAAALAAQERADALAAELDDPRTVARYALRRADLLAALGRDDDAIAAAREGVAFYRTHGPRERAARAGMNLARLVGADEDAAEAAYGQVIALGATAAALDARLGRGRARLEQERYDAAVDDFVEAVALCAERGLDAAGASARVELAEAYQAAERYAEGAEVAEEALAMLDRLGDTDTADRARFLIAELYGELGAIDEAVDRFEDLARRYAEAGSPAMQSDVLKTAGIMLYKADRDGEAAVRFGAAADAAREAGNHMDELYALRRQLKSLYYDDDLEAGERTRLLAEQRHAELDPELAANPAYIREHGRLGIEGIRLLIDAERYAEAVSYGKDVPDRLRSVGGQTDAAEAAGLLGEALLRAGRPDEAEEHLRVAMRWKSAGTKGRKRMARLVVEALEALGRTEDAAELRTKEKLT